MQGTMLDAGDKIVIIMDGALSSWNLRQSYTINALYEYNI